MVDFAIVVYKVLNPNPLRCSLSTCDVLQCLVHVRIKGVTLQRERERELQQYIS